MGYFDASGYLYVTGRKCDEIRYLKMKIQPVDIENVIHQIGGIEAACAFGIPDSIYGMIPAVAVVKSKNSKVTKEIIQLAVAEKFSGPQYGKTGLSSDNVQVHFFDSLSRLQSTHVKIDRLTIRQKIIKSPSTLYQKASQNLIVDLNDKFSLMSSKVSIS